MIMVILFVLACLVLQECVNAVRGKPKRRVRMGEPGFDINKAEITVGETHAVAQCGCDLVGNKIMVPCEAHKVLKSISNDR